MEIIFRRKWEAAHRFVEDANRASKCAQPHGHTWNIEVTLSKEVASLHPDTNILVTFETAKKKWHEWIDEHVDHSLMINAKDPLVAFMRVDNPNGRLLVTPGDPTTEILSILFKAKLEAFLKSDGLDLYCKHIKIDETMTNSVAFSGSVDNYLPSDPSGSAYWWNRPDFSTHDLRQDKVRGTDLSI
ncbi:MAG: 6-carboxytetrahydropterin synthase [Bdellovibrionales bacterium]|nr:6-carboxytetrahydropterin synthase [Bdellovibrionales bacterium]